jgi:hypothetical protein
MPRRIAICVIAWVLGSLLEGLAARADEITAADLLPPTTAVYAELSDPAQLLDLVMDHPIHKRLREIEDYQKAFDTPQYRQFLVLVKLFEGAVDAHWREGLKQITQGGVFLAIDAESKGVVLLVRANDAKKLETVVDAALTLARTDARQKGNPDPIKTAEYRGVTAYAVDRARLAIVGEWLVVTNKDELGKAVLDRFLSSTEDIAKQDDATLAGHPQFAAARAVREPDAVAWSYADLQPLREAGFGKKVAQGLHGNPLAELVLGGLVAVAKETPYATVSLTTKPDQVAISAAAPFDPQWLDETRMYYFGAEAQGAAPPLASAKDTILSLSTHRDLSEFWASAPELFNDNVNTKFAEANSNLTTLFSGRDFGDEVLAAARPELQIVVARQTLPHADLPAPDTKLPAFAIIFRLKDEAKMRRPLKVSLQSLVGFLNVVGAMNGQPPLELGSDVRGEDEIIFGTYLPPVDEDDTQRGRINYNFSPSAAFIGDRLIISSTKALAVELAESVRKEVETQQPHDRARLNVQANANASVLRALIQDNREQLIAQNMLEKGHSREEAEREIGGLLEVLSWLRGAEFRLKHDEKWLRLEAVVSLAEPPSQNASSNK